MRYDYHEINDGNVPLTGPSVTDDKCPTVVEVQSGGFNTGDTNNNGVLDAGEIWNFTCTTTLTGTGTFTNTAIGSATDQLGFTITFCTMPPNSTTICNAQERDSRTVISEYTVN